MNNTPTPETDEVRHCDYPTILETCRKLERERDEARAELQLQLNSIKEYDYHYGLHVAERDQLRKVCDELNEALMRQLPISVGLGKTKWDAINNYNSLPHVIAKKGNNAL